jgi:hypothetical protein
MNTLTQVKREGAVSAHGRGAGRCGPCSLRGN